MEELREVMRKWVTGVTVVTARKGDLNHGMTVNSLASISIDPPRIVVTLANDTRTGKIVSETGLFGVTLLEEHQQPISDRFSGKIPDDGDRFKGIKVLQMVQDIPVLQDGLAQLACRVIHKYEMPVSTLFVGEVLEARVSEANSALVYVNRKYHRMEL